MEYEENDQYVELPIHRVKKKRVMTEKQKANWQKALEVRQKNIALRKKAKLEMDKLQKEQLMSDPDLKNREKRLKELLLTILSADDIAPPVKKEPTKSKSETRREQNEIRSGAESLKKEDVVIQRIKPVTETKTDENDDVDEEISYKPLMNSRKMKQPNKKWMDESDDDEPDVNIFKD